MGCGWMFCDPFEIENVYDMESNYHFWEVSSPNQCCFHHLSIWMFYTKKLQNYFLAQLYTIKNPLPVYVTKI